MKLLLLKKMPLHILFENNKQNQNKTFKDNKNTLI